MSTLTVQPPVAHAGTNDQASRLRDLVAVWREGQAPRPIAPAPAPERRCPLIAITSGKGGVGKTTLAVNIAIALAQHGTRTTLLDADLGMANADVLCGMLPTRRLDHAVAPGSSGATLASIALVAPGGFRLIPGSVGVARLAELGPDDRASILDQLAEVERTSDIVLIDTGAGIGPGVMGFLESADAVLVVATPEPTSIADAYAMIKCLASTPGRSREGWKGSPAISLIVNQAQDAGEAAAVHQRIDAVARKFLGLSIPMLGYVATDASAPAAVRARTPLLIRAPRARAAEDVRRVSDALARSLRLDSCMTDPPPKRWGRWFLRSG